MEKTAIGVFCYKRASKLKASMEALLQNPECKDLEIVFFSDGYKGEQDKQGVLETRAYIDSLTGFKKIHKHFRERNYATGLNFETGLKHLCTTYEQFIIVEDDIVVTPNYISYLLQAFDFYRNDNTVFCISAFCFPLDLNGYKYDTIVHKRFCSYGWGAWSNRVKHVVWDKEKLKEMMHAPHFKHRLNDEGMDLYRMLKKQINGTISTWDIQMQVHVAHHNMKVIYPVISKAKNIGFDGESTNTFGIDYVQTPQDTSGRRSFKFCAVDNIVPQLQSQLKKPYGLKALAQRKIINTIIQLTRFKKSA